VREALEDLLTDRDFRVQAAAIEALGVVGDPASSDALRATSERELDGRLRRRAREIVRDLGEHAAASGELKRITDELDELRSSFARLRERLDRLEAPAAPQSREAKKDKKKKKKK
jgi:aminopeptidase N